MCEVMTRWKKQRSIPPKISGTACPCRSFVIALARKKTRLVRAFRSCEGMCHALFLLRVVLVYIPIHNRRVLIEPSKPGQRAGRDTRRQNRVGFDLKRNHMLVLPGPEKARTDGQAKPIALLGFLALIVVGEFRPIMHAGTPR